MSTYKSEGDIRIYICHNAAYDRDVLSRLAKIRLDGDVAVEVVPCGGRTDPRYILKAFESGARAVVVLACPTGHCKSIEGNLRAVQRTHFVRGLLDEAGLDPNSVQIFLPASPEERAFEAELEAITRFINGELEQAREAAA